MRRTMPAIGALVFARSAAVFLAAIANLTAAGAAISPVAAQSTTSASSASTRSSSTPSTTSAAATAAAPLTAAANSGSPTVVTSGATSGSPATAHSGSSVIAPIRIEIAVESARDGSGSIRVQYAVSPKAQPLVGRFRLADLVGTGWAATSTADGIDARMAFNSPAGANRGLKALGAPFSTMALERRRTLLSISNRLRGVVDLSEGLTALGDGVVRQRLGSRLGADPAALAAELGATPDTLVALTLVAKVAGSATELVLPFGKRTPVSIGASSTRSEVLFPLLAAASAAVLIVVRGSYRMRRRRRLRPRRE